MNNTKSFLLAAAFLITGFTASAQTTLTSEMDSLSYAIGVNIAQSLKAQNLSPNTTLVKQALDDLLTDDVLKMPADQCGIYIQTYFQKAMAKAGEASLKAGQEFLDANKKREGVVVLPSGLQYEIITAGTGKKPLASDKVKVHYHGTLIDGTVFDSSVDRGTPATFGVTQVIQGWVEALQLMPTGSKWKLFIPADLAYGSRGQGKIAPNSALIFDVELIEIL